MLAKLPDVFAMMGFLRRLIAERRAHPGDDLITRLAAPDASGDRLNDDELVAMVFILLVAGYETTVNLIATGTLLLLRKPDQLARLQEDPGLIGPAVEELGAPARLARRPRQRALCRRGRRDRRGVIIPGGSAVLRRGGLGEHRRHPFRQHSGSTSAAPTTATSPSASAPTTAWGRRWRGSRGGSRSAASSSASPGCAWRCRRSGCAGGRASCFEGCARSPSGSATEPRRPQSGA